MTHGSIFAVCVCVCVYVCAHARNVCVMAERRWHIMFVVTILLAHTGHDKTAKRLQQILQPGGAVYLGSTDVTRIAAAHPLAKIIIHTLLSQTQPYVLCFALLCFHLLCWGFGYVRLLTLSSMKPPWILCSHGQQKPSTCSLLDGLDAYYTPAMFQSHSPSVHTTPTQEYPGFDEVQLATCSPHVLQLLK